LIIKTEDFELEISKGTDVYFASKTLGQNFKKWDDLEDNEKLRLEIIQKKVERLILESKEILSAAYSDRSRTRFRSISNSVPIHSEQHSD